MKIYDHLDTTSEGHISRHSIWLPDREIKVPFQHGGRICKYTHPEEGDYPLDSIAHEYAILHALAAEQMAPPLGGWVYFKTVTSEYDGALRVDPIGAYGYQMQDATKLPPGQFDVDKAKELPIQGSKSAWADVMKPGNVVNGYLVDVRRTAWDMLQWMGGNGLPALPPRPVDSEETLEEHLRRYAQFPKGQRTMPYQTMRLGGTTVIPGAREIVPRADALGFKPQPGESVLDIGCLTGGMLDYSWRRQTVGGARPGLHAGVEVDEDYVALARDVARFNDENLCILNRDVTESTEEFVRWSKAFFKDAPDHLLLLSLEKHLGENTLWALVDGIEAKTTYIETNAMKEGRYALRQGVEKRGGEYVGDSKDRNTRRLYWIQR